MHLCVNIATIWRCLNDAVICSVILLGRQDGGSTLIVFEESDFCVYIYGEQ